MLFSRIKIIMNQDLLQTLKHLHPTTQDILDRLKRPTISKLIRGSWVPGQVELTTLICTHIDVKRLSRDEELAFEIILRRQLVIQHHNGLNSGKSDILDYFCPKSVHPDDKNPCIPQSVKCTNDLVMTRWDDVLRICIKVNHFDY